MGEGELQKRINEIWEKWHESGDVSVFEDFTKLIEEAKKTCPVWYMGEDGRIYYPWEMREKPQKYQLFAVDNVAFLKWFEEWLGDSE